MLKSKIPGSRWGITNCNVPTTRGKRETWVTSHYNNKRSASAVLREVKPGLIRPPFWGVNQVRPEILKSKILGSRWRITNCNVHTTRKTETWVTSHYNYWRSASAVLRQVKPGSIGHRQFYSINICSARHLFTLCSLKDKCTVCKSFYFKVWKTNHSITRKSFIHTEKSYWMNCQGRNQKAKFQVVSKACWRKGMRETCRLLLSRPELGGKLGLPGDTFLPHHPHNILSLIFISVAELVINKAELNCRPFQTKAL